MCCLLLSLTGISLAANDTFFFLSGGSLYPPSSTYQSVSVEMRSEHILIELFDENYRVDVSFEFFNHSDHDVSYMVGFPVLAGGIHGRNEIYDFRMWSNGIRDEPELRPVEYEWGVESGIDTAWSRFVEFTGRETTTTRVRYSATYGSAGQPVAAYLYGSGGPWRGSIGSMDIEIINHSRYWLEDLELAKEDYTADVDAWSNDRTLRIRKQDVEPDYTDIIILILSRPFYDNGPAMLPLGYYYDSSTIRPERLRLLTRPQLRLLRNMLYAMKGYPFQTPQMRERFSQTYWYEPREDFEESDLNAVERENIHHIKAEEARR